MNHGRDKIDWSQALWNRIDQAVHQETERTRVAAKFVPLYGPVPDALTAPADTIELETMTINEGETTPLIEIWVEFKLTKQQVEREESLATTVTLATRAANLLSQAEDLLIFQGKKAAKHELFQSKRVHHRNGLPNAGLVFADNQFSYEFTEVKPLDVSTKKYGERTFGAVAEGYSRLQGKGHYGPYALVLPTDAFADTYAPLASTLIMPADRIKPLVAKGFLGTGTLPPLTGLLISLGGNTMDRVVGVDATTGFMQEDPEGLYRFRVFERFALRIKDPTGVFHLRFIGN